ncbi:MAG: inositol monophosphatase [Endomicrobium sp.]|jgi:myo-inositol-1(or 4)-monophosphatase|nr:inositol monophosphatase [Endomicrobium sp.]
MKFSSYTNVALASAKIGTDVLLSYYNRKLNIEYKGEIDPVTQADKNAQKAMIKIIRNVFPEHGILAEEDGIKETGKDYCWIIDPLDGTVNFVHGLPMFCVSIGLKHKDEIIVGVIYAPIMKEVFIAEKDKGAWFNGKRINVSKNKNIIRSLATTGFPYYFRKNSQRVMKNFDNIVHEAQGVRRLGSAALDLAYVACGRFEFFWEEGLKPWDIAAGILMIKEAGGIISDYDGSKDALFGTTLLAANNWTVYSKIFGIINEKR